IACKDLQRHGATVTTGEEGLCDPFDALLARITDETALLMDPDLDCRRLRGRRGGLGGATERSQGK
ncbi:MAG TPA: hypothetical protein VMD30_07400, partial [Tepidisphaeraceae bacterium]|nr:hypothetical protein [Tepidisphaeraceae bacterium]